MRPCLTLLLMLLPALLPASLPAQRATSKQDTEGSWPQETRDPATGLRIWSFEASDPGTFRLLILVGVGSRDESRDQVGISHYLEHCLFLSTEKRSEKELIQGLRQRGGSSNGLTTQDWTAYWVSIATPHWEFAVDWLTEQLAKPRLDPKELSREQGIVVEEIETLHAHGRPPTFEALLYGDHPLGRNIAGTAASVRGIRGEDLLGWYRKHYRLGNLVVAFAGGVSTEACSQRIRKRLAELPSGSGARPAQRLHPRLGKSLLRTGLARSGDLRGFLVDGFLIEPSGAPELATLLLTETLLEDLLFDEIRTGRGLAYAPQAELEIHDAIWRIDCRIDVGDRRKLPSVLEGTQVAFDTLRRVDPEVFARAKASTLASLRVSTAQDLLRLTEYTWTLLDPGPTPDLRAAVQELGLTEFRTRTSELLRPGNEFLISDSIDIISPSVRLFWLLIVALAAAAGLIWWLPRRVRRAARHRKPVPVTPAIGRPTAGDVDDVERRFEAWFREQEQQDENDEPPPDPAGSPRG